MKKIKLVIFKIHGKPVEHIDGNDITIDEADIMKTNLAIMYGVAYSDVDIDFKDDEVQDVSHTSGINELGKLTFRADNPYASWKLVEGVKPALDIEKEELFYEFLDLIRNKEFNKAITFS